MSWESWLAPLQSQGCHGAIIGIDEQNRSVWFQGPDDFVRQTEIDALIDGINNPKLFCEKGIHIGGVKYLTLQCAEGNFARGKNGTNGVCVYKSNKALVVGKHSENVKIQDLDKTVFKICENLKEYGY